MLSDQLRHSSVCKTDEIELRISCQQVHAIVRKVIETGRQMACETLAAHSHVRGN